VDHFQLYDGEGKFIADLPMVAASSEPRWSRRSPDIFFFHLGTTLFSYDVESEALFPHRVFSEYSEIRGNGESDISADGDHLVLVGDKREIFVYEISSNTKSPVLRTAETPLDSVMLTDDNRVLVSWGVIDLYDQDMKFVRQVTRANGHKDICGDLLVWTNSNDPNPTPDCPNSIMAIDLVDGHESRVLALPWSLAVHISASDNKYWVFVSTHWSPAVPIASNPWALYTNEILMVRLDGSEVRRLAHHHSLPLNTYNFEPRVSVSRDGSRLVFNSNFGQDTPEYADVYMIKLDQDSPPVPVLNTGPTPQAQSSSSSGKV
jgi:Tol biopolymer transport system component